MPGPSPRSQSPPSSAPSPGPPTPTAAPLAYSGGLAAVWCRSWSLFRWGAGVWRGALTSVGRIGRHRPEGLDDLLAPATGPRQAHARRHCLLPHIQATAALHDSLNDTSSVWGSTPGGASFSGLGLSCSQQQFGVPEAPASNEPRPRTGPTGLRTSAGKRPEREPLNHFHASRVGRRPMRTNQKTAPQRGICPDLVLPPAGRSVTTDLGLSRTLDGCPVSSTRGRARPAPPGNRRPAGHGRATASGASPSGHRPLTVASALASALLLEAGDDRYLSCFLTAPRVPLYQPPPVRRRSEGEFDGGSPCAGKDRFVAHRVADRGPAGVIRRGGRLPGTAKAPPRDLLL